MSRSEKDLSHQEKVRRAKKDNPELPAGFISEILLAKEDVERGDTLPYDRPLKCKKL